jgi:hypothetical protein
LTGEGGEGVAVNDWRGASEEGMKPM